MKSWCVSHLFKMSLIQIVDLLIWKNYFFEVEFSHCCTSWRETKTKFFIFFKCRSRVVFPSVNAFPKLQNIPCSRRSGASPLWHNHSSMFHCGRCFWTVVSRCSPNIRVSVSGDKDKVFSRFQTSTVGSFSSTLKQHYICKPDWC